MKSFVAVISLGTAKAFNVQVGLQAGWPVVPSAAHALEFYKNLDPVSAAGILLGEDSNCTGASILSIVERKLTAEQVQLFRLLLQIEYFAPAIEAQRSVCREIRPDGCVGAFTITSNSTVSCGNAITPVASNSTSTLPSDLLLQEIYGASDHVVICGDLSKIERWSNLIWVHPDKRVFFRHDGEQEKPANVLGHGAELRIKSSEYSALLEEDEGKEVEEVASDDDSSDIEDSLKATVETRPLSKKEISRVRMQAIRYILKSTNPLKRWQNLAENFPSLAGSLLKTKKPSKEYKKVTLTRRNKTTKSDSGVSMFIALSSGASLISLPNSFGCEVLSGIWPLPTFARSVFRGPAADPLDQGAMSTRVRILHVCVVLFFWRPRTI